MPLTGIVLLLVFASFRIEPVESVISRAVLYRPCINVISRNKLGVLVNLTLVGLYVTFSIKFDAGNRLRCVVKV